MNSLLYDKKTAYISVVLMVLVSVFILGGNSLRREYNRVVDSFRGQNELGINIQQESIIIIQNTSNLLVVADRYLNYDNVHAERLRRLLDTAEVRRNNILDDERLNWESQFITADRIRPHVHALLSVMSYEEVSPTSAGHLTEIEGNINAALRRMDLSNAFEEALAFNNLLRNPYTALIAAVRGVREFPAPSARLD
ncbi:MAG: hypothetical protein FWE24_03570 [Defluviitaleaceae bacterium]|nr:hypothetical protein [Defluviitaleaceae bacterium]